MQNSVRKIYSLAIAMLLAGTVLVGVLKPLVRISQRRQIKKVADLGLINGIFGPHRVKLRDEGILNSTTGYEFLVRWSAIEDIKESDGSFLTIPSSVFPDTETLRAFGDRFFERLSQTETPVLPGEGEPGD